MSRTHQVRLESGVTGELSTTLKPRELIGRPVPIKAEIDEETVSVAGYIEVERTAGGGRVAIYREAKT